MNDKISLIFPCYNEEANIQKGVLDKVGNYTKNNPKFSEVIIIDDGSTDSTKDIIKKHYLKQFPKFKLFENNHAGKAFALITGFRKASAPYILFSDFDLATPLEDEEKLTQEINKGYQIIIGSRKMNREGAPLTRKILALGFIYTRNILIGLKGIRDTQCGFKLFERKAAIDVIDNLKVFHEHSTIHGPSVTAGFDLEFLFLAQKKNYRIKETPVTWRHVETKNVHFINDAIETLKDIMRIKYYDLVGKYEK